MKTRLTALAFALAIAAEAEMGILMAGGEGEIRTPGTR